LNPYEYDHETLAIRTPRWQDVDVQKGDVNIEAADQTTARRIAGGRNQLEAASQTEGPHPGDPAPATKSRLIRVCPDRLATDRDRQVAIVAIKWQIACLSPMLCGRHREEHSGVCRSLQPSGCEARDMTVPVVQN
jgi:hypothetical protein